MMESFAEWYLYVSAHIFGMRERQMTAEKEVKPEEEWFVVVAANENVAIDNLVSVGVGDVELVFVIPVRLRPQRRCFVASDDDIRFLALLLSYLPISLLYCAL